MNNKSGKVIFRQSLIPPAMVLFSALLLVLASPGYGFSFLAWFALAPLFMVLKRSGPVAAPLYALLAGQLFYFGHLSWFWGIDGINPVTFTLAGFANAWLYGLFGIAAKMLQRDDPLDLLLIPCLWTLIEYLHHHQGFLSLTWGTLAYTQYKVPAVNWVASFAGIYGVSFLIVFVSACIAAALFPVFFQKDAKGWSGQGGSYSGVRALYVLAVAMVLVITIGLIRYQTDDHPDGDLLKAGLVQAGLHGYSSTSQAEKEEALRRLRQLSLDAAEEGPELIVWPETAVPGRIPYDSLLVKILEEISTKADAHLLVGAAGYDKFRSSERQRTGIANSAFLFIPGKGLSGRYEKMMLVPFNEYLPLRGKVKWPRWIAGSDWKDAHPGTEMTIMKVSDLRFGIQICWENLFPDLFRQVAAQGLHFMVSITNESFVKSPAAREQMLAFNVYRAIENKVTILRAASTGISAVINEKGDTTRLQDDKGRDIYGAGKLVENIRVTGKRSFYNRRGDWFVLGLALMAVAQVLSRIGNARARRSGR